DHSVRAGIGAHGAERRLGAAFDSLGNPDDGTQTIRFCAAVDRVAASRARGEHVAGSRRVSNAPATPASLFFWPLVVKGAPCPPRPLGGQFTAGIPGAFCGA